MSGLFITSNNTNSGKTFIAVQIIVALNNIYRISAYKPIETACTTINGKLYPQDANLLNNACAVKQDITKVCPYPFSLEASGELASAHLNISIDDLVQKKPQGFCVVEGAGGFFSPLIKQKLNADLAIALNLLVVIVIEDKLGAISEALLTILALKQTKLDYIVVLNTKDANTIDNYQQLKKYTTATILKYTNAQQFHQDIRNYIKQVAI